MSTRRTTKSATTGRFVVLATPSPRRERSTEEKQALARALKRNQAVRTALGGRA